jgi:SAM-dependent methyltransferase
MVVTPENDNARGSRLTPQPVSCRAVTEPDDQRLMARRASSFGAVAAQYAEYRPRYPDAAIEWILEPVRTRRTIKVLDLAAGTGRLTEALQRADVDVIAVEPDPEMRAQMQARVFGVAVLAGKGEDIPLPDERVDVVAIGQALHWMDQEQTLPEIARVLRPGGVLAALWNIEDDSVGWVAEYSRLIGSALDEQESQWPPVGLLKEHEAFGPAQWERFPNPVRHTIDSLVATVGTHSATLVLEPAERAEKLRLLREFLQSRPETSGGEFELPLITGVARAVKR